jgi:hypothetical protein
MEQSTQKRALGLKDKIPDIQKTLETVQFLKSRDVCLDLLHLQKSSLHRADIAYAGRCRTPGNIIRTKRHPLRQSQHRKSRRGLPLVRRAYNLHPQAISRPWQLFELRHKSRTKTTTIHPRPLQANATSRPGQRHALLSNPRSRRTPIKQAKRRATKSEQLRGRSRLPP